MGKEKTLKILNSVSLWVTYIMDGEKLYELIQRSNVIRDDQRLDIFEFLADSFSLVPLRGGYPHGDESPRSFKAPLEKNWQQWRLRKIRLKGSASGPRGLA